MHSAARLLAFLELTSCAIAMARTPSADAHRLGCTSSQYTVTSIPLTPVAINNSGIVVGKTDSHRAALWSARIGLRELPMPEGYDEAEASGINSKGIVVGTVRNRLSQSSRAFYYADGRLVLLPGTPSLATDINDKDEIVGQSLGPKGTMSPAIWRGFRLETLQNCCGGSANAINRSGEVIGNIYDAAGQYHATSWSGTDQTTLLSPEPGFSAALAITNDGTIIVRTISDTFLYKAGSLRRLDVPRERRLKALAINACHVVVGAFGPYKDANRAFLWDEAGGFRDLNSAIESGSKWVLETATSINARGVIVGTGDSDGDDDSGFILAPRKP
jgi:probable HAF family extracellular repeat protein